MLLEVKELLQLFGIPFIMAPQEAEAQCAFLNENNLVDGIITDDSDVFLFNGTKVYRNMFKEHSKVEFYDAQLIKNKLKLDRLKLIELAELLGSDYTEGVKGVGLINAMEIIHEFGSVEQFYAFCFRCQQGESSTLKWSKMALTVDIPSKHKRQLIQDAYCKPVVDENKTKFEFGHIQMDKLQIYLQSKLKWSNSKTMELIDPILQANKDREEHGKQQTISDFFKISDFNKVDYPSSRLTKIMREYINK